MRIGLNGWQRIGVVFSVLWVLSVGGLGALEHVQEGEPTHYFVDTVKVQLPPAKDLNRPGRFLSEEEAFGYRVERHFRAGRLIATMLAPIALFWALAYICVFIVRWVVAGFRRNGT